MKRVVGLAVVVVNTMALALPAIAVPDGPDGDVYDTGYFTISISEDMSHGNPPPEPRDSYSSTRFDLEDGWDFGDRNGYRCAWVEFYSEGDELFEVHYQLRQNYRFDLLINDKYGKEEESGACGGGRSYASFDRSDHFPHGTALTFFQDGQRIAAIKYGLTQPGGCDKAYWVPGDQPGEAWLWWDEDGPEEHMPGHPLDCGGGPGKPRAVVRASVRSLADGVVACVRDELDGDMCKGEPSTQVDFIRASAYV